MICEIVKDEAFLRQPSQAAQIIRHEIDHCDGQCDLVKEKTPHLSF